MNRPRKPLFIPLKREHFEAFASGIKETEYRPYGPRWNERTCTIGRPVVLSLGYGRAHRITGTIASFTTEADPTHRPGWVDCYGTAPRTAACIGIQKDSDRQEPQPELPLR